MVSLSSLQTDLNTSLKAGNTIRVGTLRLLIAAVRNAAIATYGAQWETLLTEADIVDVAKKQVKTHKESILAFAQAHRQDLVEKESGELAVLEEFTPKELTDDELRALLNPLASTGEANFGLVMKQAMALVQGRTDGSRVSAMLKELLAK